MTFKDFPALDWDEILPGASSVEVEFVKGLLKYEGGWRMTAEEVCSFISCSLLFALSF